MHAAVNRASLSGIGPAASQEQNSAAREGTNPADAHQHAFCPTPLDTALKVFIEHFEQGLAIVDKSGRVLFLNREAQAIVCGTHLCLANGRLCANVPSLRIALRTLIADCAACGCGASLGLGSEADTLLIAASALPSGTDAADDPIVLLRLVDPVNARYPAREALQAHFGLTPTEAAFALEMLAGNDLAASAVRRKTTLNTARVHLRRIFEKTGTHRQASLMRLLLLCPKPIVDQGQSAAGSGEKLGQRMQGAWMQRRNGAA